MGVFLLGILGGVLLSLFFSFGPAFFSQIQTSIHYGFRNAVPFAYGVSTSDVIIVAALLSISNSIPIDDMMAIINSRWVVYIGAAVVAGFGLYTIFLKTRRAAETSADDCLNKYPMHNPSRIAVYLRGLSLNFFNPGIWVYWATVVALIICGDSEITRTQRYIFFGGVLATTLSLDILKCKLASMLQRIITFRFLNLFNKSVGIVLIGFATFMLISSVSRKETENPKRSIEVMQGIINTKPPTIHSLHNWTGK